MQVLAYLEAKPQELDSKQGQPQQLEHQLSKQQRSVTRRTTDSAQQVQALREDIHQLEQQVEQISAVVSNPDLVEQLLTTAVARHTAVLAMCVNLQQRGTCPVMQ